MYVVRVDGWIYKLAKTLLCLAFCLVPAAYASAEMKQAVTTGGQVIVRMVDGPSYRTKLLVDVNSVLYDNDKHKVGTGEYVSIFQTLSSNSEHPSGFCGAGSEVWLYVYQVKAASLIEKAQVLVSSCLRSISLESQNSGAQQQELDFSSVSWNSKGFSIQWFEHVRADGRSLQRSDFVVHEGALLRQDLLIDESQNSGSLKGDEMKGIIRIGDKTTGGGTVLSGSNVMRFDGIGVAREGDPVRCPVPGHGRTVIAEGHPAFRDNGVPVAFDGHRCACGCALISSLPVAGAS